MIVVPAATPNTVPDTTVAAVVALLLQEPPGVASVRVILLLIQTCEEPIIGATDCASTAKFIANKQKRRRCFIVTNSTVMKTLLAL